MEKEKPKEKAKKPPYYEVDNSWGSGVQHGSSICVQRNMRYLGEKADFKPFLSTPIKELEERLKASQAEEKKVYEQLQEATKAWDVHGAQTLLLRKVIEYLKVPEVKHTGNEWVKQKDGSWEISNLVYKMTFSIVRSGMDWKLAWEVSYTAPSLQHGYHGYTRTPRERIDYEGSKKYKTMDGAQKYVQLKFDQYSGYFKELSPPVPPEAKELFCVNGQLLQGYTLGRPKAQKKEVSLQDLLDCIEDGDVAGAAPKPAATDSKEQKPTPPTAKGAGPDKTAEQPQVKAAPAAIPKEPPKPAKPNHPAAKKKPPSKKKSAPVR